MSKFYYTDPLAAAWMVMRFGMRFVIPITVYRPYGKNYTASSLAAHTSKKKRPERYYIHEDDVAILEPQLGDMINDYDGMGVILDDASQIKDSYPSIIIQRNGAPFMWPHHHD